MQRQPLPHIAFCAVLVAFMTNSGESLAGIENMAASDGNGVLQGSPAFPSISKSQSTAMVVTMNHDGNPQSDGLFLYGHVSGGMQRILTEGDALPGLDAEVGSLLTLPTNDPNFGKFPIAPQLNKLGLGCTFAGVTNTVLGHSANEALLRYGGPEGVAVLMAESQSLGNTGRFVDAFRWDPAMNDGTGIAWLISTRDSLIQPPPQGEFDETENPEHAVMVWLPEVREEPIIVALSGDMHTPTTGTPTELGTFARPRINQQNKVLFASGTRSTANWGVGGADHLHLWSWEDGLQTIMSKQQVIPSTQGTRSIGHIKASRLGPTGEVVVYASWTESWQDGGISKSKSGDTLFKWENGTLSPLFSIGDPAPWSEPDDVIHSINHLTEITDSGGFAMVLEIGDMESNYPVEAVFTYGSSGLGKTTMPFDRIPGFRVLNGINNIAMNESELIAISCSFRVTRGNFFDDHEGIFLLKGGDILEVDRAVTDSGQMEFAGSRPLTNEGQIAYLTARPSGDINVPSIRTARLFTPELKIRPYYNFWDDSDIFTWGIRPGTVHRVSLTSDPEWPTNYLGGPSEDTTIRHLSIGGGDESLVFIRSGGAISSLEGIDIASNATMSGSWTLQGAVRCMGSLSPGPDGMTIHGQADLSGSRFDFTPGGPISITGDAVLPASIAVMHPTPVPGDYDIIHTTGIVSGPAVLESAPSGMIYEMREPLPNRLVLRVREAATPFEAWQITQFGSNVPIHASPDADPDHDGQNNQTEFLTGTLPLDGASSYRVVTTRMQNGTMRLEWPARAGKSYRIETSDNLVTGWTTYAILTADSDGSMHTTVPIGEGNAFFRVVLLE